MFDDGCSYIYEPASMSDSSGKTLVFDSLAIVCAVMNDNAIMARAGSLGAIR